MVQQRSLRAFIAAVGSGEIFRKPFTNKHIGAYEALATNADEATLIDAFVASLTAIKILKRDKDKLQKKIDKYTRDKLTGLFNRHGFAFELSNIMQSEDSEYAIVLLDLDGFKDVNDTLGHDAGDAMLQAVARRLSGQETGKRGFKKDDILVRQGGDEFLVVMPLKAGSDFDEDKIKSRVHTMLKNLYAYQNASEKILPLCASMGIVRHKGRLDMDVFDELVKQADEKAYADKSTKPQRLAAAESSIANAIGTDKAPEPAFSG